ncbi:MAG: oligoendopeptidase F [Erysipelotrichaceae bacterium]
MNREEIEDQYKWDLTTMFKNQAAFDEQFKLSKALLATLVKCQGKISINKHSFITFMEQLETFQRYLSNLYSYASLCGDVEPNNQQVQENKASALLLYQQATIALSFVDIEFIQNQATIQTYLKDQAAKDFTYPLEEVFRSIPHRLSEDQEKLMAQVSQIAMNPQETYDAFRLEFEDVIIDGKPQFLNAATYSEFLRNPNVEVRKQAYENLFKEYKRYENVFASTLTGHAQGQVLDAQVHHFDSALQASLFEDGVDETLFNKVLAMANHKHHQGCIDYYKYHQEVLGLKQQHPYDIALPIVNDIDIKYSIEECFSILNKAFAPLGEEYLSLLNRAKDEHWIDFMTHSGKRPGAYSGGSYDSNPFVLMNFTGGYDSLSTLAHELGHSMHSYYSNKNNRPILSDYRIFVAEIASTVNEILLNKYLLANSEDKQYKAYILANLLEQLVGTLYRQPMFAKFEVYLYERIEKGEAISTSTLTSYYEKITKEYFGDSVICDELEKYRCYYVPHFYYNFYVYKYTLGMSVALSFVRKIEKGETSDYLNFLKKGGSESPLEECIHGGVDPLSDQIYDDAFHFFNETLNQLKALQKKD